MNERIKTLVVQCRESHLSNTGEWYTDVDIEKFAELLIKECANIARQAESDNSDDYKSGRIWASLDILEHFGV